MYALWCCYRQLTQLKLITRLKAYLAAMAKVCDFPLLSIDAEIIIGFFAKLLDLYQAFFFTIWGKLRSEKNSGFDRNSAHFSKNSAQFFENSDFRDFQRKKSPTEFFKRSTKVFGAL